MSLVSTVHERQINGNVLVPDGAGTAQYLSPIIFVEAQQLVREALGQVIVDQLGRPIQPFSCIDEYIGDHSTLNANLCILKIDDKSRSELDRQIELVRVKASSLRLAVISDVSDWSCVKRWFSRGIKGYILANQPLEVSILALRLVQAGGVYLPAELVMAEPSAETLEPLDDNRDTVDDRLQLTETLRQHIPFNQLPEIPTFTPRQKEVIQALRTGKPNKLIAYELNMSEGTVKVHVRSIMRKLKATNRTEAVFLINEMLKNEIL